MDWLVQLLGDKEVDALLVAGDIFDTANPPAQALELWYSFLATCATRLPGLQILVTGGNHDSAARLDAPRDLLRALKIQVIGGARRDGVLRSPEELVVQLPGKTPEEGKVWVAAVPFLRPVDLPVLELSPQEDLLIEGVRRAYHQVYELMRERAGPKDAFVAMGHLYLRKGQLSELSERKILGGNQHALPLDLFPEWLDYVALGHLHRAQAVGRESVRYCGSPIPLAMDERHYRHEVCLVDLHPDRSEPCIERIRVPREIPLLRIPDQGSASFEEVLAELDQRLASLPAPEPGEAQDPEQTVAFVEAAVRLSEPDPELRAKLESACEAHGQLLSSLIVEYVGKKDALGQAVGQKELSQLSPQDVLCEMHQASFGQAASPELLSAFHELLETVGQEGDTQ